MANELPQLPEDSLTVQAIYKAWKDRGDAEQSRGYLGASSIGKPCDRALWYSFRHCGAEKFSGRMYRLFNTGHLEEPRMAADLRAIGCEVHTVGEDGEQFEVTDIAGHFRGHMDGAVLGVPEAPKTWHVLECKTHSNKSFKALKDKGVMASKPEHYAQCVIYMYKTKMDRALYLARNKDTDELYSERIYANNEHAKALLDRARRIIESSTPPERINEGHESFDCRFCSHKDICHGSGPSEPAVPLTISCRSCVHSTPEMDGDGRWSCAKHLNTITRDKQDVACDDHLLIPGLVVFAKQVDAGRDDAGNDWIEYQNADGTTWRQGKGEHNYTTSELTKLPGPLVGAGTVQSLKDVIGVELCERGEHGIDFPEDELPY